MTYNFPVLCRLFAICSLPLISACATDGTAGNVFTQTMNTMKEAVSETFTPGTASSSSASNRPKNSVPADLKGFLAPEKKTGSGYPRVVLALTNIDGKLWSRAQDNVAPNACMTVNATIWDSPKVSRPMAFQWCSPENIVNNVPWRELDYYWFAYKSGAMASNAPRRGSRLGPETPKLFWPGEPDDLDFLGVDYNGGTSALDSFVALGVASIIYHFDLDWEKTDDQRIWVSSIDKSGPSPKELLKLYTPVYKTP